MTFTADPDAYRIVGYGKGSWNRILHTPLQPITERTAKARHGREGKAGSYGVVLTTAPEAIELPVAALTRNEHGITVSFYEHDPGKPNLTYFWKPTDEGSFGLVQIDRRAGNGDHIARDQLIYEYLKVGDDPVPWVRWTDAGAEVLERRALDVAAFDRPPPEFGQYRDYLDRGVAQQLWPGLPELEWIGPELPVTSGRP